MASLDKLAIRGIRSFDDKQVAVIEFFSPVTVIVGHNGSGKTTIIECLKYATTGDQPPNTRGGAFVHDPKIANEKEVKAQVKLRFKAANGTRMLAARNMSVTVSRKGTTFKTLEAILSVADDKNQSGKRGTISTKCAEMDVEIPHLLGVSKAVLENVIFCHQEDSYWPLAEPATLKKKFDDIFEATKYTKALDSIKSLRKDRVAELKTDKERLESLSFQKNQADKIKNNVSQKNSDIAAREIEYEETKEKYERMVVANEKFYDSSTKFREIYIKVDSLNSKKKELQEDLDGLKQNLQELPATDEELSDRYNNFNEHIQEQNQKKKAQESHILDLEDDLNAVRVQHREKVSEHGRLTAEAKAHQTVLEEREGLIRELSVKYQMKGFDHSPLEREKVLDFISRLTELQQRQNQETERLQDEAKRRNEEYNASYRQRHSEREGNRQKKQQLRERTADLQTSISKAQNQVDNAEGLTAEYKTVEGDIEEKERRIQKVKDEIKDARFEDHVVEKTSKIRELESKRDALTNEIRILSLQADSRARLDLKREESRTKETEMRNTIENNNPKFRKLVGDDAKPETMERELERVYRERNDSHAELESVEERARKKVQSIETLLSSLQAQVKTKRDEMKRLDQKLRKELDASQDSPQAGIDEAQAEIVGRKEEVGSRQGAEKVYKHLLRSGKSKKRCPLCTRDMNTQELGVYETTVNTELKKSSEESIKESLQELADWESELKRLQTLAPIAAERDRLKNVEIPSLETQIREKEGELPEATKSAEDALARLNEVKKEVKDIEGLKVQAGYVSRTQAELQKLLREISGIETDLLSTGSTKTVEDVQVEHDAISNEVRALERERQSLTSERDRQTMALRTHENDHHALQLRLTEVKSKLRDKSALEQRIEEMRQEIADSAGRLKELDAKITELDDVIERLEQAHQAAERESSTEIAQAQRLSQELNMSVDKLSSYNRTIERYVREKRGRLLKQCEEKVDELDNSIALLAKELEEARAILAKINKEIDESGASMANLRDNIRARMLVKKIAAIEEEIDQFDLEEAARAKRNFEEKYQVEKEKETELQVKYAHIGGQLTSMRDELKKLERDLREFKDITKKYRDQLIKVKLSDMANNDLEKYAKALDAAIMKYHSLKMEEVNDTMRHLWNKTYQGTDIDGIKIRSDTEGAANKRSYNYRVVMTKDQVEMDMRGRCSAGQKMLASIIIRLALADSFGQNCGILALDEPTNALDTDNIDALASSLVDLINERKGHSNFQLIVITHDENFLRKLGQSDVMEHYWRVSRDPRQKSIIERHRFG